MIFMIVCYAVDSSYHLVKLTISHVKVHFTRKLELLSMNVFCVVHVSDSWTTCQPVSTWVSRPATLCHIVQFICQPAAVNRPAEPLTGQYCIDLTSSLLWVINYRLHRGLSIYNNVGIHGNSRVEVWILRGREGWGSWVRMFPSSLHVAALMSGKF